MPTQGGAQRSSVLAVERDSLQNRAKEAIQQAILTGVFQPGDRMVETRIAEMIGLSRSTVRAALQALIQDGLLVQEPFKGAVVMPLTAKGAYEVATMREALETLAVKLAAESASATDVDALERRYEALIAATSSESATVILSADIALHQQIIAMTRHELLQQHYKQIEKKVLFFMSHVDPGYRNREAIERQHSDVVAGIRERDAGMAVAALGRHFAEATSFLVDYLQAKEASEA